MVNQSDPHLTRYLDDVKFKSIIDYILVVPVDKNNKNESFKFPFVCNDILSSQSSIVMNFFFPQPKEKINMSGSMILIKSEKLEGNSNEK